MCDNNTYFKTLKLFLKPEPLTLVKNSLTKIQLTQLNNLSLKKYCKVQNLRSNHLNLAVMEIKLVQIQKMVHPLIF